VVSEIGTEPQPFDFLRRKAKLTSASSRSAPAKRPHVGGVFYLLLVGLVAAAIIGVFFGIAFSLLHTAQGPYRCRCRAGVSRYGGSREHRKGYDEPWRPAGDNRRFRRDRPGAASDIAYAGLLGVAATGELD
jgi:Flp pilus assembly pilin Flp